VAENSWKLLPQYLFDPVTSNWVHRDMEIKTPSLLDFSLKKAHRSSSSSGNGNGKNVATTTTPPPTTTTTTTTSDEMACAAAASEAEKSSYYAEVLSQSKKLYETCHALYNTSDLYATENVPDYEKELFSGDKEQFSWFLFPKEVVISAKNVKDKESWICPAASDNRVGNTFIRPELYWGSVLAAAEATKRGE
jgi:hypothetical protein